MQPTTPADGSAAMPRSLQPSSLLRRAVFGFVALVSGVVLAAWLLHASIDLNVTPATATANQPASTTQN